VEYLGEFEQVILFSVLQLDDAAFGLGIREDIEARTGRVVSSGAIYTALGRMERKALVVSRLGDPVAGRAGRPRKYYELTTAGARALHASLQTVQAMSEGLLPRLTKLAEG